MFLEDLKLKISSVLDSDSLSFSYPVNSDFGDLSLACFHLVKDKKISPVELAKELVSNLNNQKELKLYFSKILAIGPYVNFFISKQYLAENVIKEVGKLKNNYGINNSGLQQRVMIEYSNGNTHKEYHVGHLRNISYGDAINHLLKANGYQAVPVSYINDFGIHTAKTIWNWYHHPVYEQRPEPKGFLLGRCYAQASKLLEENPDSKFEVAEIMKEIENRQGKNYRFWKKSRQWSIDYFNSIYKELNIKFVHTFYESELIDQGLKIVKDLISRKILIKSQGAIIADLEKYGLGVLPIIRSNGTALYAVADLALASEKFDKYKLDQSIYIVDVRQTLYFQQLFKILELMGYKKLLLHLTYDFVTLPEGMMSSRTGNIITYQELRSQIFIKLLEETKKRHNDWSLVHSEKVAQNLTLATIKFEMLKVSADKIIIFDIDEASRTEGYTACYIQYSYARLKSIIRKGGLNFSFRKIDLGNLKEQKEKNLLLKIAKYPEIISLAGIKYNPSELARYLFELAQLANDYYHEINILKSETEIKRARLVLIRAISQVLANGFNILGIEVLEKM